MYIVLGHVVMKDGYYCIRADNIYTKDSCDYNFLRDRKHVQTDIDFMSVDYKPEVGQLIYVKQVSEKLARKFCEKKLSIVFDTLDALETVAEGLDEAIKDYETSVAGCNYKKDAPADKDLKKYADNVLRIYYTILKICQSDKG